MISVPTVDADGKKDRLVRLTRSNETRKLSELQKGKSYRITTFDTREEHVMYLTADGEPIWVNQEFYREVVNSVGALEPALLLSDGSHAFISTPNHVAAFCYNLSTGKLHYVAVIDYQLIDLGPCERDSAKGPSADQLPGKCSRVEQAIRDIDRIEAQVASLLQLVV